MKIIPAPSSIAMIANKPMITAMTFAPISIPPAILIGIVVSACEMFCHVK